MFGRDTHTPKPDSILEPKPKPTLTIAQVCPPTALRERRTKEPYYESYRFWKNPENIISHEDIAVLYRYQYGENFNYIKPSEESVEYTRYQRTESLTRSGFRIPSVWGGNKG